MSRRGDTPRRDVLPDAKYNDKLVSKLMGKLLSSGKKSVAEHVIHTAFDTVAQKTGADPLKYFKEALDNIRPVLEVRSRRVGGATYQVPVEVRPERRISLGLKWLIDNAYERGGRSMEEKLAAEIMDAHDNKGGAVRKKEDVHRMAEANRAFAHYRW